MVELDGKHEEKLPSNVHVDLFFGFHRTAEDLGGLREHFNQADAYIMESVAWTPKLLTFVNDVSKGLRQPTDLLTLGSTDPTSSANVLAELEIIHGSGKPIGFIDVPFGENSVVDDRAREGASTANFFQRDFRETLEALRQSNIRTIDLDITREEYMLKAFPEVVNGILENNPELRSKKDLKVLIYLGSAHWPIAQALESAGFIVTAHDSSSRSRINPLDESLYSQRRDGIVSDELLAQALVFIITGRVFKTEIDSMSSNTTEINVLLARATSRFSLEDVADLYSSIWTETDLDRLKAIFKTFFYRSGFEFPESRKQLEALISESGA